MYCHRCQTILVLVVVNLFLWIASFLFLIPSVKTSKYILIDPMFADAVLLRSPVLL